MRKLADINVISVERMCSSYYVSVPSGAESLLNVGGVNTQNTLGFGTPVCTVHFFAKLTFSMQKRVDSNYITLRRSVDQKLYFSQQ